MLYLAMAFFVLLPVVLLFVQRKHLREEEQPAQKTPNGQSGQPTEDAKGMFGENRESALPLPQMLKGKNSLSDRLNADHGNIGEDLAILQEVLRSYHRRYKENPTGRHEEIVARLIGQNQERWVFISPDHPAYRNGQLFDRWGTPFRFHALSVDSMEIRSAGPDRQFGTEDDFWVCQ